MKSGFDYRFLTWNVLRPERPAGNFGFNRTFTQGPNPLSATGGNGIATLLLGAPTDGNFTIDPTLAASQKYYAWYFQNDWKARRNLTFNLGLRWEYPTPWTDRFNQLSFFDPEAIEPITGQEGVLKFVGRDGNSRYQTKPDKNNFAPRLGMALEFMKDTVLRVSYGLSYYPGSGGIGAAPSDVGLGGWLPISGVFLGSLPFPNTPPPGASLADPFKGGIAVPPTTNLGEGITQAFLGWRIPYNHQWNLNIQRALTKNFLVEAAYIGNRGEHIWINRNRNAVDTKFLSLGTDLLKQVPNPFFGRIGGFGGGATVQQRQLLRPFPHYGDITRYRDDAGDSIYHALTLRMDRRFAQGLLFQVAYTMSKNISNVPERFIGRSANFLDPNNLSLSRSVSENDRPQRLVINYVYEMPFGPGKRFLKHGWGSRLLGSWEVTGITTFQSGLPVVITGGCSGTNLPGVGCAPLRVKSPVLPDNQRTLDQWFDITAFTLTPAFSVGTDSRTEPNLRGPGTGRFDMGIYRNQRIKETMRLQFGADIENLFNHPQLSEPNGTFTSPDFGKLTGGSGQRQIQIRLRLSY